MTRDNLTKPHWLFWVVCIIALLWNVAGSANYLMQTNASNVANMPQTYQAFIETRPAWATAAFAITVFAAVIGSILLLLKRYSAMLLFVISTIALMFVSIHAAIFVNANPSYTSIILGVGTSVLVALFLLWFTKFSKNKNWIG